MSTTGLASFDSTVNTTNIWLHDIMERMDWDDRHRAYHALRVVLHALRDHLSPDEAAKLGAQLPMLVRGFYYEGWHPGGKPVHGRKKEDFLAPIAAAFRDDKDVPPEQVARAVFQVMSKHITGGEIKSILHVLPGELRDLWAA